MGSDQPTASPMARDTRHQDIAGMGFTAGQRTAEVFAGLRAELMPSKETGALARLSGRAVARLIIALGRKKVLNFVPVRHGSFAGLVKRSLGIISAGKTLVEIAAGFSPRGITLAQEKPELKVIEIDLPDVVAEKQKRLAKGGISIPPNLTWKTADLGVKLLDEVLDYRRVDVISAEGLMPYFEHSDITRIAKRVYKSLKPGGVFIADLGHVDRQGEEEAGALVRAFRRYTSSSPGTVESEEVARRLFRDASFEEVSLYRLPETAEMFDLPRPISDVLFIMVARRS